MPSGPSKKVLPYLFVLGGAVAFFGFANRIEYAPIPGQIGPDVWPKLILGLLMAVCCIQIGRLLFVPSTGAASPEPSSLQVSPELETPAENPVRVGGVIATSIVYLLLLQTGGFFLCTLVYTAGLLALGGLRHPARIAAIACAITVFFTFTFMKVIFVSLPIGVEPFAQVSLAVMSLLGIH
jgi:putative tricarboxylic transport membrane protein